MKIIFNLVLFFGLAVISARAQEEVPPPMPAAPTFSDGQLQQLLGPIALYPDPLIAVMLPAATLPTEIVLADRYVSGGGDPNQIDQQPWDANVQALAHYPAVLKWMDDNLNWTTQLGEVFENQQQDVMNAIQELRTEAYNLGNLQSTPQQQVIDENGYIEILPVNPSDVYVPQYQPNQVYYVQPSGVPLVTFGIGFAIGPWLCGDFDWRDHRLVFWDRDHRRPAGWWHEKPQARAQYIAAGHGAVWNRANHPTFSPGYQGDRGYNNQLPWTAPAPSRQRQPQNRQPGHPEPQPNLEQQHLEQQHIQNNQPSPNAFIGIENTRQTRDYSNRGEHSMETMPQFRNLGAFHGASPPPSGGFHGSAPPAGNNVRGGHAPAPSGGGRRR
ncbi:MAG: DUF3300 domain-containing protein [Limisphaerales bacterium]